MAKRKATRVLEGVSWEEEKYLSDRGGGGRHGFQTAI
jgi:hypothetical protein